ncbi:DUF2927 domain-containing protein [Ferrovibrio sp.]|uniref:DUF2927 domain-containing protein n=1 Tax=Ferrovibrio sp. TaxID=1917215 RepID=UPI00351144D3
MREPSNAALAADFMTVAFYSREQILGSGRRRSLYKADQRDVCLIVAGEPGAEERALVSRVAAAYSLTNEIQIVTSECRSTTNLVMVFVPREVNGRGSGAIAEYANSKLIGSIQDHKVPEPFKASYSRAIHNRFIYPSSDPGWAQKICMFGPSFKVDGAIFTMITISMNFGYMQRCIYEETLQALGLPFDSTKSWPSIIRVDHSGHRVDTLNAPSSYDLLYLRVLYDPRLRSGMSYDEVKQLVEGIIAELRPDESRPPDLGRLYTKAPPSFSQVQD